MRLFLGFVVAPLAPALLAWLLSLAPASTGMAAPGSYATVFIAYGYPVALLVGVPAFFYFRRRGWLKLWQVALAGAAAGSIPPVGVIAFLILSAWSWQNLLTAAQNVAPFIPLGMVVGCISAAAFWVVAVAKFGAKQQSLSHARAA